MNLDRFHRPNLKIPIAITCGFGLAILLGLWAGSGEFAKIAKVTVASMLVTHILFFLRYTWMLGLLVCFCGFYQIGFGFTMGELELSMALGGIFFATTWWIKVRMDRPPVLEHWSYGFLNAMMLLWILYVAGHTAFNIYLPYRPEDYALKNLLKTVEGWTGPFLLMLYFLHRPGLIVVSRSFPRRVAWGLLIGLSINIAIRFFQLLTGRMEAAGDPEDPTANNFVIPVVGLMENVFALRTVPPTAMLFCGAVTITRWFKDLPRGEKRLFYLVMGLSVLGAILSGGRATLAFVLGLFAVVLFIERRIGALLASMGVMIVIFAAVNVMPDQLRQSPTWVQRSLNWALVSKNVDVSEGITGSTNWRLTLFHRALDEWRSDPRIYWFGRATYKYSLGDFIAYKISGEDATIESSLRRGTTHNLITDLLVTFGLVGLILYFSLAFVFLYFLWILYRSPKLDELGRILALVLLISLLFNVAYGVLGGATFPVTLSWLMIILVTYLYREHARLSAEAKPPAKMTPSGRPMLQRPHGFAPATAPR